MQVIVRYAATGNRGWIGGVISGTESIRVVTEALGVNAGKQDHKIGSSAVVGRIETIGFAPGPSADLDHLYIHPAQTVDDSFTGRTGIGSGQDKYPLKSEPGRRTTGSGGEDGKRVG